MTKPPTPDALLRLPPYGAARRRREIQEAHETLRRRRFDVVGQALKVALPLLVIGPMAILVLGLHPLLAGLAVLACLGGVAWWIQAEFAQVRRLAEALDREDADLAGILEKGMIASGIGAPEEILPEGLAAFYADVREMAARLADLRLPAQPGAWTLEEALRTFPDAHNGRILREIHERTQAADDPGAGHRLGLLGAVLEARRTGRPGRQIADGSLFTVAHDGRTMAVAYDGGRDGHELALVRPLAPAMLLDAPAAPPVPVATAEIAAAAQRSTRGLRRAVPDLPAPTALGALPGDAAPSRRLVLGLKWTMVPANLILLWLGLTGPSFAESPAVFALLALSNVALGILNAYVYACAPTWRRQRTLVRIPLPSEPGAWMASDLIAALPEGAAKGFFDPDRAVPYAVGHDGTTAYLLRRKGDAWRMAAKAPLGSPIADA